MKMFTIPNLFTLGNLFCGCLAIVCCMDGNLVCSAYLVAVAALFDFLDGFLARLLKQHSEIGKQLDSLADIVTFGVVPGVIIFVLLRTWCESEKGLSTFEQNPYFPYIAFIIPLFSALRLAKFNVDVRQSDSFIGLPTPVNAILISSIPLMIHFKKGMWITDIEPSYLSCFVQPYMLIGLTVIMSLLLISEIPFFALKFKSFGWKENAITYIFLAVCLALIFFLKFVGIPFAIALYILLSLGLYLVKKKS